MTLTTDDNESLARSKGSAPVNRSRYRHQIDQLTGRRNESGIVDTRSLTPLADVSILPNFDKTQISENWRRFNKQAIGLSTSARLRWRDLPVSDRDARQTLKGGTGEISPFFVYSCHRPLLGSSVTGSAYLSPLQQLACVTRYRDRRLAYPKEKGRQTETVDGVYPLTQLPNFIWSLSFGPGNEAQILQPISPGRPGMAAYHHTSPCPRPAPTGPTGLELSVDLS
ncbi:hypothetical protein BIW11_02606 [Tropilaelaps mercedesae]|uniref:Uncharacterized protein n=1 Tax=Tropilaelaps mercedesae TaxID=418985 RepID=A0A1V9Y0L1_9ACAR|nr:hypothetical protein BIW11_02606 [Tropilaelaps mercedesae]